MERITSFATLERKTPELKRAKPVRSNPSALRFSAERTAPLTLSQRGFAERLSESIKNGIKTKSRLALLIAAHNEEKVLEHTIRSATGAGLNARDIYVVDDNSSDATSPIAEKLIGKLNVLKVERSGKGMAIHRAAERLRLTKRYDWIHIADADGEFDSRYFSELGDNLNDDNAAATGYVTSLPGSIISQYRVYEYALGMEVVRRFQALAKVISIIPGPTSIFRSDVFEKLRFNENAIAEDFNVTLQIHRNKLGNIQYIPDAIARTQDPGTFKDYIKQITRWNRGVMQMIYRHGIGKKLSKVDAYIMYQIFQNLLFFFMYGFWVPFLTFTTGNPGVLAAIFMSDVIVTFSFVIFAASRARRWDILSAFPIIYGLRWVSMGVFIKSFVEVVILKKFRLDGGVWETVARRSNA